MYPKVKIDGNEIEVTPALLKEVKASLIAQWKELTFVEIREYCVALGIKLPDILWLLKH